MKNSRKKIARITGFALMVILLLPVMAAPVQAKAPAGESLARLTIVNNSKEIVYLELTGDRYYYFVVPVNTTKIYTPVKGEYAYVLKSCGIFVNGTFDLTKNQKLVVPRCGDKDGPDTGGANVTDASKLIRLVDVKLENSAKTDILLILTGPATYVFSIPKGETHKYTIAKGGYTLKLYACGKTRTGNFWAYVHKEQEFFCPPKK